jgi:hypothetical protein
MITTVMGIWIFMGRTKMAASFSLATVVRHGA